MITNGSNVIGKDFNGNEVVGTVEHITGFADEVAIVRISKDRLGLTEAYIEELNEVYKQE